MPLTQLLQSVEPTYYQDAVWPDFLRWSIGDPLNFGNLYTDKVQNYSNTSNQCWISVTAAGGGAGTMQFYRERMCARLAGSGGSVFYDWWFAFPRHFPQTISEGAPVIEERRVWWDSFFLAKDLGVDGSGNTGVRYYYRDLTNYLTWPQGYGLYGVDNGWEWRAYDNTPALMESVALAWPAAIDDFAKVDILQFAATPASPAVVQLYVNDTLLLSRTFDGVNMPTWGTIVGFTPTAIASRAGAGLNRTIYMADMRFRTGVFDFAGVEVS